MRVLIIASLVVVMAAGLGLSWLMHRAGQFKQLEPVTDGVCVPVAGAPGAEDLSILRRGVAVLSSYDRRAAAEDATVRGELYLYDLRGGRSTPRRLDTDAVPDFRPHGLSLYEGDEGVFVHVVNHPAAGDTIEIFELRGDQLVHLETVTGELLVSPNDVLAVAPRRFYATNDHGSPPGTARLLEDYLQLPRANVIYWDGDGLREAATGIAYANGINMSRDGREVYVASTTGRRIHLFVRDLEDGSLTPNGTIQLDTGADNIEVDRHGMLWIGAHPKLFSFVAHAGDASKLSPSEVLWVDPDGEMEPPVRTAYLDLGEQISGSSVAAPWGSRLLIGSVFEPHFLDCERDPEAARGSPLP